ncbi:MAG: hypothetical protein ABS976_05890, partial [Rhodococcus sp. (in: high G+C Gram-positive bacteria)]
MTTKPQLEQRVCELETQLDAMTARAERAELGVPASTLDVVGYWILNPQCTVDLWDGELHRTLTSAQASLADPKVSEGEREGWGIYEVRPFVAAPTATGPWQTWQEVPEGVWFLTDRNIGCWMRREGDKVTTVSGGWPV